jgi:hypothetical protein
MHAAGALPFLLFFPAFVWIPVLVERHSVGALDSIGRALGSGLAALEPGVALLRATLRGDAVSSAGWLTILTLGLLGSGWVLVRWLHLNPIELCCPQGGQMTPRDRGSLPLAPCLERRRSAVALFIWKDLLVERTSRPTAYLGLSTLLLAGTCFLGTNSADDVALIAASAGLGMPSLGAVGREGPAVSLLRHVFRPRQIFAVKWAVGWADAAAHLPVHAIALTAVSAGGPPTSAPRLLLLGLAGTGLFSLTGTALGFLLPDPARRSFFLPGSSRAGQLVYLSLATPLVGILG